MAETSTNQARMIAREVVRQQAETCSAYRKNLDDRIDALVQQDSHQMLSDLRVKMSELQTQLRITWILLIMVVSGLVSVAFSVWRVTP